MNLTAANVDSIIKDVLMNEVEAAQILAHTDLTNPEHVVQELAANGFKLIDGVMNRVAVSVERVANHRDVVVAMLQELPKRFHTAAGGSSFLHLPMLDNGTIWGDQVRAEMLLVLALALDLAEYSAPRDLWDTLPGGVPYVIFKV